MNKKFSTLVAGFLLAGGLFSANAQVQVWPNAVAGNGFYHVLKVHDTDPNAPYNSSYSISLENGALVQETNFDAVAKSNAWTVTEVKVNGVQIGFEFTNANDEKLQFDTNGAYTANAANAVYSVFKFNSGVLKAVDGQGNYISNGCVAQVGGSYALNAAGTNTKMYTLPTYSQNANELNEYLEDGFAITIGKTKGNVDNATKKLVWDSVYDELEGNVFSGELNATSSANGVTLKNADGKTIVLTSDQWGNLSNSLQGIAKSGYKFEAMTAAQIAAAPAGKIIATEFKFTQPNAFTAEPLEVKAIASATDEYELMVAGVNGTYYLTTGDAADPENEDTQLVGAASFTNNWNGSVTTENTYVKFGLDNMVDYTIFNDAVWNITRTEYDVNGKVVESLVAGTDCASYFLPETQVALAYPEGQWLWNGSVFVNRESGAPLTLAGLRTIEGQELTFSKGIYTYTFTKVGEPSTNYTEGYLSKYTNDDLLQKAFRIATPVKATGDTVYLAKDEEGALYLSADKASAVAFRLERAIFWNNAGDKNSQTVRHYTTYASDKTNTGYAKDVLNLSEYWVSEATTGEWLSYDYTAQKFILSDTYGYSSLIFKNKAEGLYNIVQNLIEVDDNSGDNSAYVGEEFTQFCNAQKLYGAHNTAELKQADWAYDFVANDLFILEEVGAEQHVSNIEGATIKIFREADNNYFLFEKDGFLDLKNFLDPAFKNAAIYADSAAGKGTWRQEYLLALRVNEHKDGYMCPFNPLHNDQTWRDEHNNGEHCADAVPVKPFKTGSYLVNLVDSAKAQTAAGIKDAQNIYKFQNYGNVNEPYYRLGFVPATHVEDSLIIASTNDTIIVSSNNFAEAKVCDFAFHYVNDDRTAFIIETAYDYNEWIDPLTEEEKYSASQGFIKYHNGIPVVTPKRAEAEVFTLEETDEAPTANEDVEVSEVSIVASNAAIIVKGAAGKTVAISNILGQTIANAVVSSDNETIAVPAGIAVVAVEGEEAVKVVVK